MLYTWSVTIVRRDGTNIVLLPDTHRDAPISGDTLERVHNGETIKAKIVRVEESDIPKSGTSLGSWIVIAYE
jgi:hypothetical protein